MSSVTLSPYPVPELTFSCTGCRTRYQVASTLSGKVARCSKCLPGYCMKTESRSNQLVVAFFLALAVV